MTISRRYPIGAEVQPGGGVHFRVWAPKRKQVKIVIENGSITELSAEADGYFAGSVGDAITGARYRFRLDGDDNLYPDPTSRFQPEGPHGPSQIVDPSQFRWTDADWKGSAIEGAVITEIHLGTFTPEGTWAAAAEKLGDLKDIGINVVEFMPIADFPGKFGWGYDGVNMFAPCRLYGTPDDLRRFIDRAHALGIGVILDVVYNHVGPDGNYLSQFSDHYISKRYDNEWGDALNFDGDRAGPVREFFACNADYWIHEFHFDGLRLDATQQIFDDSDDHILAAITRRVREAARGRRTIVLAENELQQAEQARPVSRGGMGMDGLWNDDFHHSAVVALTGRREAYYSDHRGTPQEFISALKYGYLFQGQFYHWQGKRRGTPAFDLPPAHFVNFIENHDQVANSGRGDRLTRRTSPGRYRAMTALLLLAPSTPMLFQGQEFASSRPFHYFADHHPDLAKLVAVGRTRFMRQFPSLASPTGVWQPAPHDPATFAQCQLQWAERDSHSWAVELHRDLLRLRREDPTFSRQRLRSLDGAILGTSAFLLRYFSEQGLDRLLLVNFGPDLHQLSTPEPLFSPPAGQRWKLLWSSEHPNYGGYGTPELETEENWIIPGDAAFVMAPRPAAASEPESPRRRTGRKEDEDSYL